MKMFKILVLTMLAMYSSIVAADGEPVKLDPRDDRSIVSVYFKKGMDLTKEQLVAIVEQALLDTPDVKIASITYVGDSLGWPNVDVKVAPPQIDKPREGSDRFPKEI